MKSIHQNQEASRDTAFTYTKEKTANNYDAFDGQPQSLKVNKMRWDTYRDQQSSCRPRDNKDS